MKVAIVGAHGLTGQQVIKQLAHKNHSVTGIVRKEEHRQDLEKLGASHIVKGDLAQERGPIEEQIKSNDAFIFAAGAASKLSGTKATPELHEAIDRDAAKWVADVCAENKKRFIMLSAIGAYVPDASWVPDNLKVYMKCKNIADTHIQELGSSHDLAYTIVRPGGLTDEPGTGKVYMQEKLPLGELKSFNVSRENVASVIVGCLEHSSTVRKAFDFVDGETDIEEALSKL
eukprot:gb/GECH01011501.1/.p1 GENE.gb/GECH01011501.1/~~gb/GECH01011501.1/.p1  ORF type:complete len:230 (+),score=71.56 gb/GECH01011501.1/:1-690(+)